MRKWIVLSLLAVISVTAQAVTVTFEPVSFGTAENPVDVSSLYDIYITTDDTLFSLDNVVTVTGPAEIVYATGKAGAPNFGWSSEVSEEPIYGTSNVEIGLVTDISSIKEPGRAAKITLKALDIGDVLISLTNGTSFENPSMDTKFGDPTVTGNLTIYQATPEPLTVALLGLGALVVARKRK